MICHKTKSDLKNEKKTKNNSMFKYDNAQKYLYIIMFNNHNCIYIYIYIYIYVYIVTWVSWPSVVKGNQKAPFSIATPFPGLFHILDPYLIMLSVKQRGIKYLFFSFFFFFFFESLVWLDLRLKSGLSDHWQTL